MTIYNRLSLVIIKGIYVIFSFVSLNCFNIFVWARFNKINICCVFNIMCPLKFLAGATSNLVTFQVGDPEDNYNAVVVIRVSDIFGDYSEVEYKIRVSNNYGLMKFSNVRGLWFTSKVRKLFATGMNTNYYSSKHNVTYIKNI